MSKESYDDPLCGKVSVFGDMNKIQFKCKTKTTKKTGGNGAVFDIDIINPDSVSLSKDYVVKFLKYSDDERRYLRFKNEIVAVKEIHEKNIPVIPIIDHHLPDVMREDDPAWYIMPKADAFSTKTERTINEKLLIMREILCIIYSLHENNKFHRDIKAANIMKYDGRYCLTDYGLVWDSQRGSTVSVTGEPIGPQGLLPYWARDLFRQSMDLRPEMQPLMEKLDINLFSKVLWMTVCQEKSSFDGEYRTDRYAVDLEGLIARSDKSSFLADLKDINIEPLHELLTRGTSEDMNVHITAKECRDLIDSQIDFLNESISNEKLKKFEYQRICRNDLKTPPDKKVMEYSEHRRETSLVLDDFIRRGIYGLLVHDREEHRIKYEVRNINQIDNTGWYSLEIELLGKRLCFFKPKGMERIEEGSKDEIIVRLSDEEAKEAKMLNRLADVPRLEDYLKDSRISTKKFRLTSSFSIRFRKRGLSIEGKTEERGEIRSGDGWISA